MSSAERFVRHHNDQTDRAISRAYAGLAKSSLVSATFRELLQCVRNRAPRLLDAAIVDGHHPGVEALVNLSRFKGAHIRRAADWPGTPASWRSAVCSLAQHLIGKYAVPPFLAASWYATRDRFAERKREWFVAHGRGVCFRSLDIPIDMTRKMEHIFLKSPDPARRRGSARAHDRSRHEAARDRSGAWLGQPGAVGEAVRERVRLLI